MAKHLPDDIDRLQCHAVVGNDGKARRQFVTHFLQHRAGGVEFGGKPQVEGEGAFGMALI
jgi:hypothetical protein